MDSSNKLQSINTMHLSASEERTPQTDTKPSPPDQKPEDQTITTEIPLHQILKKTFFYHATKNEIISSINNLPEPLAGLISEYLTPEDYVNSPIDYYIKQLRYFLANQPSNIQMNVPLSAEAFPLVNLNEKNSGEFKKLFQASQLKQIRESGNDFSTETKLASSSPKEKLLIRNLLLQTHSSLFDINENDLLIFFTLIKNDKKGVNIKIEILNELREKLASIVTDTYRDMHLKTIVAIILSLPANKKTLMINTIIDNDLINLILQSYDESAVNALIRLAEHHSDHSAALNTIYLFISKIAQIKIWGGDWREDYFLNALTPLLLSLPREMYDTKIEIIKKVFLLIGELKKEKFGEMSYKFLQTIKYIAQLASFLGNDKEAMEIKLKTFTLCHSVKTIQRNNLCSIAVSLSGESAEEMKARYTTLLLITSHIQASNEIPFLIFDTLTALAKHDIYDDQAIKLKAELVKLLLSKNTLKARECSLAINASLPPHLQQFIEFKTTEETKKTIKFDITIFENQLREMRKTPREHADELLLESFDTLSDEENIVVIEKLVETLNLTAHSKFLKSRNSLSEEIVAEIFFAANSLSDSHQMSQRLYTIIKNLEHITEAESLIIPLSALLSEEFDKEVIKRISQLIAKQKYVAKVTNLPKRVEVFDLVTQKLYRAAILGALKTAINEYIAPLETLATRSSFLDHSKEHIKLGELKQAKEILRKINSNAPYSEIITDTKAVHKASAHRTDSFRAFLDKHEIIEMMSNLSSELCLLSALCPDTVGSNTTERDSLKAEEAVVAKPSSTNSYQSIKQSR